MLNLLLAILSSALVSVGMRLSERHGKGRVPMLAVNYVVCTIMAAVLSGMGGDLGPGAGPAIGLGVISGVLYLGSFVLLQWCVGRSGVILSAAFMKLGVLVPTVMAIVVFNEAPRAAQLIGIALTAAAILLMNMQGRGERVRGLGGLLILLVAGGMTDGMSKIYEATGAAGWKGVFLLVTFGVALVLCIALAAVKKQKLTRHDWLDGLLIGIPNYFSALFLLRSLSEVPAVAAYPTYSVATIAAVSLAGVALFRERLTRRQWLAMGVIAAALILLNI